MLRVGIVAEGPSDWLALEEMIRTAQPDADFLHIRPDMTLDSRSPHGWSLSNVTSGPNGSWFAAGCSASGTGR